MRRVIAYALLLVMALLLQAGVFPSFRLFGATPELVLASVWLVGTYGGSERGATVGFFGGLLQDLYLGAPKLGIGPLIFCLAGMLAGRLEESLLHPRSGIVPFSCAAATLVAGVAYRLVMYVFGYSGAWNTALPAAFYTGILSVPLGLVVRRMEERLAAE
jgi:rod shape-determining protein MreD